MTTSVMPWLAKRPGAPRPHWSVVVTAASSLRPSDVGDEDDGSVERFGVLEEHANVRLEPTVGEEDDGVVGLEGEQLVGERRSGVHERAAGLPDPLRHELPVRGEVCGRPDASPDHSVACRRGRRRRPWNACGETLRVNVSSAER